MSAGIVFAWVCFGFLLHHISVLQEMSQARGSTVWPSEYARTRPYKLASSALGVVVSYLLLMLNFGDLAAAAGETKYLLWVTAIGAGYISDSAADRAGKMVKTRLQ